MKTTNFSILKSLSILIALIIILPVASTLSQDGVVSLNKATVEDLLNIEDIDIDEDTAKAIVKYREKNGPFKKPEDLLKVPGMTDDLLEEINPVMRNGDVVYDPDAEPSLAPSKC